MKEISAKFGSPGNWIADCAQVNNRVLLDKVQERLNSEPGFWYLLEAHTSGSPMRYPHQRSPTGRLLWDELTR